MKEIKAYIRPEVFASVATELGKAEGVTGMSAVRVYGFGRSGPKESKHDLIVRVRDFPSHIKVEIVCADDKVEQAITAIEFAARTGLRRDGKIYLSDVGEAVRIETAERGEAAV